MLVREYPDADVVALRGLAQAADERDEWFVHEGGRGGLEVTSPRERVGEASNERVLQMLFSGGEFGPAAGDWLFFVGLWTPADYRAEFLAWYRFEHLPILLEHPAWSGCRFLEQQVADGCQFFAMHQMRDRVALESPQRKLSRATPWFLRLAGQPWFDVGFTRNLYTRVPR